MNNYAWSKYYDGEPPAKHDRAICPGCGKKRAVEVQRVNDSEWNTDNPEKLKNRRKHSQRGEIFRWSYLGYGFFCSLRCATNFANKTILKTITTEKK